MAIPFTTPTYSEFSTVEQFLEESKRLKGFFNSDESIEVDELGNTGLVRELAWESHAQLCDCAGRICWQGGAKDELTAAGIL